MTILPRKTEWHRMGASRPFDIVNFIKDQCDVMMNLFGNSNILRSLRRAQRGGLRADDVPSSSTNWEFRWCVCPRASPNPFCELMPWHIQAKTSTSPYPPNHPLTLPTHMAHPRDKRMNFVRFSIFIENHPLQLIVLLHWALSHRIYRKSLAHNTKTNNSSIIT